MLYRYTKKWQRGKIEKMSSFPNFTFSKTNKQTCIQSSKQREFYPDTYAINVRELHTQLHCIAHLNNREH